MAVKAYKVMQLLRGANGGAFDKNHQSFTGRVSKIDESLAETYNSNSLESGKLYVEDPEITARIFLRPEKKIETPKSETPEQKKYDLRKEKLITAGFTFDEDEKTFTKGESTIEASQLVDMAPVTFGKLLKN